MKVRGLILVGAVVALTGCAVAPQQPSQKMLARADIEKISKVEIFYHPSEYVVLDLGGSGATGMSGLFGVVGLLAATAIDAASRVSMADRAETRSKEFTALVSSTQNFDINKTQAQRLADLIKKGGREVKLTPVSRPAGDFLADKAGRPLQWSEGYSPLYLRVTTGYGAESATASYKSLVVTEFLLKDPAGKQLVRNTFTRKDNGTSYQTFQGLKDSLPTPVNSLQEDALVEADNIYENAFIFPSDR